MYLFRNIGRYKLTIFIVLATSVGLSQIFIPTAFWAHKGVPVLTISDGPTYSFGTLAVNSTTAKSFAIFNSGDAVAASMSGQAFSTGEYVFKGGSFPGTGGTCTGSLLAGQSCSVIVETTSTSAGTFNSNFVMDYWSTNASYSASRAVTATYTATVYKLEWINSPSYIKVSDCVAVTIQRQDTAGNPVTIGTATAVTGLLFNNGAAGTYHATSACGATITTTSIAAGTNSVTVYFKSTTSNQSGILVATAASIVSASKNVTITTAPTKLFTNPAPRIRTSTCTEVPISTVDANNYSSTVGANTTINLSNSGTGITFYSDAACTATITSKLLLAGNSSVTVYVSTATTQTANLTASATGLTSSSKAVDFATTLTWWNASWYNRMRIDINNTDVASALTNQPVLVRLTSSNVNYSLITASGADIRFVASDDSTLLNHQIEKWNYNGTSEFWVKVPSIAASSSSDYIYMYFNNPSATDAENPTGVWTNYWSVWHLNESPTATAPQYKDSTSNVRHGTALNSPAQGLGQLGNAVDLSGATDAVQINQSLAPAVGSSSTFSAWIRTTQIGNNTMWQAPGLTGIEQSGGGNDIFFGWLDASGRIGVTAGNGANAQSTYIVNNNTWRHVTISRNSTTGQVKFYINGVLNVTATSETGNKTTYFDLLGEIGDTGGTPVNYNGMLDEVRIINSVRTDNQIKADFKFMVDTHLIYGSTESGP